MARKKSESKAPRQDVIAEAVRAELERRKGTAAEISVNALAKESGLFQSEIAFWLADQRNLRCDKASRVLQTLALEVRRKK